MQLIVAWIAAPYVVRYIPGMGRLEIFVYAAVFAVLVWIVGLVLSQVLRDTGMPSSGTLVSALVVALIAAAIYTWLPMFVPDAKRFMLNLPGEGLSAHRRADRLPYPALAGGRRRLSADDRRIAAVDMRKAREPEFPRPLPRVAVALPIPASLRSAPCCIRTQNMPKTTAVRKAKDTMAASTLSLVRSSIAASFAGQTRP